ncbi:MAG: deoxyguanosinetriphosphate triphosphohydrolase [Clostridia bacterium]|nr:deoxyguanosinetriphosphate triphosphohydrolase [Clostridia bacterium]
MKNYRIHTEQFEKENLSSGAALAANTLGRSIPDEEDAIRTCWQRDRDRIIHCKSFRRLKHKTQVFLSPEGDHYRTRLTHTLEVSQIARTIARALGLNEDLTEAIALGHDLGHTPFGHAGERALDAVYAPGFKHYEQSVRVVEKLEKDGKGLNLTQEVKNGILCHTKGEEAFTLEGRLVRLADRIAYINHDIDDALRAGVIAESEIADAVHEKMGFTTASRINALVISTIEASVTDATDAADNVIKMQADMWEVFDALNAFMFERVYLNPVCKSEEKKADKLIKSLYAYFCADARALPEEYKRIAAEEGVERAVCDYIAGMTDHYAVQVFDELFVPQGWGKV